MSANMLIAFCAQALLVQSALSQCIRGPIDTLPFGYTGSNFAASFGYNGLTPYSYETFTCPRSDLYDPYFPAMDFTPTNGRSLPVTSISPISPTGIVVMSDNAYEGPVSVIGELPFAAAVVIEGMLPTAGVGGINHACGNGVTAMISEGIAPVFGPGVGPFGSGFNSVYGPSVPARLGFGGCGSRMLY